MAQFKLPTSRDFVSGEAKVDVAVNFTQYDDNLFIVVDGVNTGISLWFHRVPGFRDGDRDRIIVSMGRVEDDSNGDWTQGNDYLIDGTDA